MKFVKPSVRITSLIVFVFLSTTLEAMERRRDQFTKVPGYYISPIPIILGGLGKSIAVAGSYNNAHDSYTDYAVFMVGGNIQGGGLLVKDIHLLEKRLILDVNYSHVSQVTQRRYNTRGMQGGQNNYIHATSEDNNFYNLRLTGTFEQRMVEVFFGAQDGSGRLTKISDQNQRLIQTTSGAKREASALYVAGLRIDWTDDYHDPRRGVRYEYARWQRNEENPLAVEYYQSEHNLTAYLPIGKQSSWLFNYFQADAHVTRQGETDLTAIAQRSGLDCDDSALTATQRDFCLRAIRNTAAHNQYGTVGALGGRSRLRSYPGGRFNGAHALFYGTEFRWNITDEFQPFDIWLAKDVRTGVQLAFFYETATVADTKTELGDIWRDSYGIGGRIVTASGLVFRADYATGDEGEEITAFISYPWEIF
ncbi:MAG: hypothetical protein OEY00_11690 [Gammaproteobacteria bacterium]|nr:hypothetical protein [Gammaproteobacteria bacterium]